MPTSGFFQKYLVLHPNFQAWQDRATRPLAN